MKKKSQDLSDLISIACHYDNSTLLTKNGELVQIIKIKGFSKRFSQGNNKLRDVIREIISNAIGPDVMFIIYSKRDYMNIDPSTVFQSEFAQIKHEIWVNENGFRHCLMNSLYIAIVHKGAKNIHSNSDLIKNFFLSQIKKRFFEKLNKGLQELSDISIKILNSLEEFGVSMLSIVEKDNKLISEPLSFIFYLTHFYEKDVEISTAEYSKMLAFNLSYDWQYNYMTLNTDNSRKIDFNGDILTSTEGDKTLYAGIMTLKNHYNLPIKYTDQILSLNQTMVIYETIKLTDKNDYSDFLEKQRSIFNITKSQGIFNALEAKQSSLKNCSLISSQVGVIVFGESEASLHQNLKNTKNLFFRIGLSTIREDYYMMGGILSAIPGNSFFFRRENPDLVTNSALFASIKQKTIGGYNGSIWGKPIATFKTVDNLPYFFNFHNAFNIGHTIIVGPEINKPHLLRYFLICESFKFDLKVVNFDYDGSDDEIMTTCSAKVVNSCETPFSIDMFRIMNHDPKFIQKVFEYIIFKDLVISDEISNEVIKLITQIIDIINKEKASTIDFPKLSNDVCNLIQNSDVGLNSDIKHNASEFFKTECFFRFFCIDNVVDDKIVSINLGSFLHEIDFDKSIQKRIKSLIVFLFLKDLNSKLEYSSLQQTIITFDSDVLDLCNIFYDDCFVIFEELAKKHVVFIITCENRNTLYNSKNIKEIITKLIPTRFFLSDKFVDKPFKEIFDLNHVDINTIKMYNPSEHMFLLKQDDQSIVASFKILNNLKITK